MSLTATATAVAPYLKYLPYLAKGYNWLTGGMPNRADNLSSNEKTYMNFLQQQRAKGMGQDVINQQLSSGGRQVSNFANTARANVMQQAVAGGVEGSGVVAEQSAGIDSTQILAMANIARNIAEKNRQVKEDASTKLGEIGIRQTDQKYQDALSRHKVGTELIGDIGDLAGGYMSKVENKKKLDALTNQPWWNDLSPEEKAKYMEMLR